WITWSASLAESEGDFERLIAPVGAFLNDTPQRVPATDWYLTTSGKQVGFQARPVVGGVFVRLLEDTGIWSGWVARGAKATARSATPPSASTTTKLPRST